MRFNVFFFVNAKVRTFAAEVQPHGYSGIRSSYKLQTKQKQRTNKDVKLYYIIIIYNIIIYNKIIYLTNSKFPEFAVLATRFVTCNL